MGDMAEFWNDIKEYRKEQKEKYDNKIHPIIQNKLEELSKLGFNVVSLNGIHHQRINGVLDIFPQNKRYHNIKKNERGSYRDLTSFVLEFFKNYE